MEDASSPSGADHHPPTNVTELTQERKVKKHKKRKTYKRSEQEDPKPFCESFALQITMAAFALALALLSTITLSVCMAQKDHRKTDNNTTMQWPCVDCSLLTEQSTSLSLSDPLMENLSKRTVNGILQCCAESSEAMSALIQMVMWSSKQEKDFELQYFYPGNFSLGQASIHKRLLPSNFQAELEVPKFLTNHENVPLLFEPKDIDHLVEHVRGVELMHQVVVISHAGLYYIYSSVLFKPDSAKPCKDYERQSWDHNIVLSRNKDKVSSGVIFRSVHTCCDECLRDKATSFTGGTLQLQENDELHVEVSGYSLVSFRKESSFFGLVMLGKEEQ